MKHKLVRIALVVLEAFVALGAVAGGIALLRGTFAQGIPVAWLQGTPFSDYTIPGLVLAIVVGGGMGVAAITVFIHREWAVLISVVAGIFSVGFGVVAAGRVASRVGNARRLRSG